MNKRIKGQVGWGLGGSGGSGNVMGEWFVGQWIVGIISFQKIFGLCGLKCHIVEIWRDVTLVHGRTTDGRRTDDGRNVKIGLEFWNRIRNFETVFLSCHLFQVCESARLNFESYRRAVKASCHCKSKDCPAWSCWCYDVEDADDNDDICRCAGCDCDICTSCKVKSRYDLS